MDRKTARNATQFPYITFLFFVSCFLSSCGGGGDGAASLQPPPREGVGRQIPTPGPDGGSDVRLPGQVLLFTAQQIATAVSPDGTRLFVSDALHDTVGVVNLATRQRIAEIAVGRRPSGLVMKPDGNKLYVLNKVGGSITVVDPRLLAVSTTIAVGSEPVSAAISPNEARLVITNDLDGSVSIIDTSSDTVVASVTVELSPVAVGIASDSSKAYVANRDSNSVSVIDLSMNTVRQKSIQVGDAPVSLILNQAGDRLFVANRDSDSVTVIDTGTDTVIGSPIATGPGPLGLALTPDGATLFTANSFTESSFDFGCQLDDNNLPGLGNTLTSIDANSMTVINGSITVGQAPVGLAILSDSSSLYAISGCEAVLSEVATANQTVTPITMPDRASAIALGANDEVYIVHPESLSVFEPATRVVTSVSARGRGAYRLALAPTANRVFASRPGDNSVIVFDAGSDALVADLDVSRRPSAIVVDDGGDIALAAQSGSPLAPESEVTVIAQAVLAGTASVGEGPISVAFSSATSVAVVPNFGDLFPIVTSNDRRIGFGNTVSIIDLTAPTDQPTSVVVGVEGETGPISAAVVTDGVEFFGIVANYIEGDLALINLQTSDLEKISVPPGPILVGSDPTLNRALVLSQGDPFELDSTQNGVLTIVDPTALSGGCAAPACASVGVGRNPSAVAVVRGAGGIPDRVLVTNFADDTVTVFPLNDLLTDLDAASQNRVTLTVGDGPVALAVADTGNRAWIANYFDSTVSEIALPADANSIAVASTVTVPASPTDLIYNPATQEVWVASIFGASISVIQADAVAREVILPN